MKTFETLSVLLLGIQADAIIISVLVVLRQLREAREAVLLQLKQADEAVLRQLQQAEKTARTEGGWRHADSSSMLTAMLLTNPKLNQFVHERNAAFAKLKSNDEKDFYNFLSLAFGNLERLHTMWKAGWLEKEEWDAWKAWMTDKWIPLGIFEDFWKNEKVHFTPLFKECVDEAWTFWRQAEAKKAKKTAKMKVVHVEA